MNEGQPYQYVVPNYGAKMKYVEEEDSSELLDKDGKTYAQHVVGTFIL